MAKDKKGSKPAAPALAAASKPLESVKDGRVTKPVEKVKAVAADTAKKVADGVKKGSKKLQREPSPSSSSEGDDDTSDSSASSDDEKEDVKIKSEPKSGGAAKAATTGKAMKKSGSDSESDSDSSSASDSEDEGAKKKADAPKLNGAAKAVDGKDDSSSGSDSSDDDAAPKLNGKAKAAAGSDSGSDEDSDGSSGSSGSDSEDGIDAKAGAEKASVAAGAIAEDSSDASSSDDESDEEEAPKTKVQEPVKKRKAEEAIEQTPKKTKVTVNGEEKEAVANLFVGNLSWNVDEEWLTREFEEFGEISGVRVITDRESGRSKGYGYVEFSQVDSAVQALEARNESELDGRNIRVDFSLPRPPRNEGSAPQQRSFDRAQRYGDTPKEPSKTLFVGNVAFGADESMLSEIFQEFGTVTSVRLPTDRETEQIKGYGYVDFTSIEEAKAAFEACQGTQIEGRPIRLDYASSRNNDSPRGGGAWTRGAPRGRGGFNDRGGRGGFSDRGGRGGFNDRGRGRGGPRGGRGGTTNRGGFGDFSGKKISF